MSQILRLKGGCALSAFRLNKLLQSAAAFVPRVSRITAEYWHFVQVDRPLNDSERARLERILSYGPASGRTDSRGDLLLVVPRIGTISPWSSKASDVAHHCGLSMV